MPVIMDRRWTIFWTKEEQKWSSQLAGGLVFGLCWWRCLAEFEEGGSKHTEFKHTHLDH